MVTSEGARTAGSLSALRAEATHKRVGTVGGASIDEPMNTSPILKATSVTVVGKRLDLLIDVDDLGRHFGVGIRLVMDANTLPFGRA